MAPAKLQKMFGAQDMTQGEPWRNLVRFSVPLLIGNFAQQLYSTVDSIVVGQYVGDNALAAVGASGPIINLLLVLLMGISTGAGIMVSQYYGAHDRENLSRTIGNCITLTVISAVLIMVVGLVTTYPILAALQTPAAIIADTHTYLIIIYYGMLGMAFYNIISGILRGLGDSVSPLIYLLVACGLNIALDMWFVIGFDWGVAGVAWATIIAQGISGFLCLVQLCRMRSVVDINLHTLRLHKAISLRIGKLGLPSGITQAIFSMAMIMVQALTNSFGEFVITCTTVVMRVDGFAMMPNFTFGM
ncbi:MAG: MATE family efflux transporter, partial [Candidatus Fimadaptatus sp.]